MVITMVVQRHDDVINRNIIIPRRLVGYVESVLYMYIYVVCDIQTFIDVTLQRIPFSIYNIIRRLFWGIVAKRFVRRFNHILSYRYCMHVT